MDRNGPIDISPKDTISLSILSQVALCCNNLIIFSSHSLHIDQGDGILQAHTSQDGETVAGLGHIDTGLDAGHLKASQSQ